MAKTYRIYFLNDAGHVVDAVVLQCETDNEAVAVAESQDHARAWELWNLDRRVRARDDLRSAH